MQWAGTTDCDADGRHDLNGLLRLALRCVAESGEVVIRRADAPRTVTGWRSRCSFRSWSRTTSMRPVRVPQRIARNATAGGGKIIQGIEFDAIGKRVAYWLYPDHPGSQSTARFKSHPHRVPG